MDGFDRTSPVSIKIAYDDGNDNITTYKKTFGLGYPSEDDNEIYFLLEQFKNFLLAAGYVDSTVSHIQFLEDEEWKYVLTKYNEWNNFYEKLYENRAGRHKSEEE